MSHSSQIHLRATQKFIDANSSDVTLKRRKVTSDGQGGRVFTKWDDPETQTIDCQTMRLLSRGNLSDADVRTTSDGRTVIPTFLLVSMPDATAEELDIAIVNGRMFEIVFISRNPEWRQTLEAVEFRGR